ncbi:UNVERIFIED_CONTAM: hypothetical protein GTU68_027488, partial [Idotea baltica]|nr:hypothetical protein [Idotea baltica]
MAYQLGKEAIKGLIDKTDLDPSKVDRVIMGNVISNIKTSNVARESALSAGVPSKVPCNTVVLACISANQAIAQAVDQIQLGHADIVIAGGTDSVSDIPILLSKSMRQKLYNSRNAKAEFSTGRTMGQDCDRMVERIGVKREDQDAFALRSHQLAAKATEAGHLSKEIVTIDVAPDFVPIALDNGIRGDSKIEKLASLKPAFNKPYGTLTAANSSFLTDGAAAVLVMSEDKARELGYKPKAKVVDYVFVGQDPEEELLLGPAYATAKILDKTGLSLSDMDVFEFHEAFAGQVLANIKCLESDQFAQEKLGKSSAVG